MVDMSGPLMSSKTGEHTTPDDLFWRCSRRWGPFDVDAAATDKNTLCDIYYTKERNALLSTWVGKVWCNPPYGRDIDKWVKRSYDMVDLAFAQRVVMLLPARTDTRWWQAYVTRASEVHFLKGRVKFSGSKTGAPFPSAIVVFERPFA